MHRRALKAVLIDTANTARATTRDNEHAVFTAILLGFFCALRKDNLTTGKKDPFNANKGLRRADVMFHGDAAYVKLRSSKTNQFGAPAHLVPLMPNGTDLCPVAALRKHIELYPAAPDAPLLQFRYQKQTRGMTHATLVSNLKHALNTAGLNPRAYAGHSLRRGGATLAFSLGAHEHQVRMLGAWASDAVLRYNEASLTDKSDLPQRMALAAARDAQPEWC